MSTVEQGLSSQVRNIVTRYGRTMEDWYELVKSRGLTRHGEILSMLKADHGVSHGDANRVALVVRDRMAGEGEPGPAAGPGADPVADLFDGKKAASRSLYDRLVETVQGFGGDIELAPKRGYVSVRRRKQFALFQPATGRVDVGLILKDAATSDRLEPGATFNAMFTHRVRVPSVDDIDAQLVAWLRQAYDAAG